MKKTGVQLLIDRLQGEIDERQRTIALLVNAQAHVKAKKRTKPRAVPKVEQSA
jgi:hypothetical protein